MTSRLLLISLLLVGCRSDDASTPIDSHGGTIDGTGSGSGSGSGCASYTDTSIASMRMGTATGCYKLTNVVTLGVTPSTSTPQLFVQDAAGGDFSALETKCSSGSTTHPCTIAAMVKVIPDGHSVTVTGTYIKTAATTFEEFFIDNVVDNGVGTPPAAATATLADIERGSTATNLRFQRITITIGAADMLQMYDWTPDEFTNASATACPYQFGFGMLPKSVTGTGTTATPACTSGTAQPAGQVSPNAHEVLIGTDFFKGFTVSSDCRCAKTFTDMEPTATSTLSGTVGGLLGFDVPFGATLGYYYLDPKSATDAPITNLAAGM
jgi:hypothetical protein